MKKKEAHTFNSVRYISNTSLQQQKDSVKKKYNWEKKNDKNEIPFVRKQENKSGAKEHKSPVNHTVMFSSFHSVDICLGKKKENQ